MQRYRVRHTTRYSYTTAVTGSQHAAVLQPMDTGNQTCERFKLKISPESRDVRQRRDYFGNTLHLFSVEVPHRELAVCSESVVQVLRPRWVEDWERGGGVSYAALRAEVAAGACGAEVLEHLYATPRLPMEGEAVAIVQRHFAAETPVLAGLQALMEDMRGRFRYESGVTDANTGTLEFIRQGAGVCQDFAQFMIVGLRGCGIPARYVSGYLRTYNGGADSQLRGADASHAWVSVWVPQVGWVEVDPTNTVVAGDGHIRVAYGRDFGDVSMLRGAVRGGGAHALVVEVTVGVDGVD